MVGATHPRGVGFDKRLDRAQIQGTPPSPSLTLVITQAPSPATPAPSLGCLTRANRHHNTLLGLVELDILNNRLYQSKQPRP